MDYLKLTSDKLSVEAVSEMVVDDKCGAVSLFVGTTRDNFDGKKVLHLEYEAYEAMAINALKAICNEVREKWPNVHGIAMYHRLGSVPCKEASVVIAVSSPHRQDSLSAVSYCIDQLKATVPIWKKEVYDGSEPMWKENKECPSSVSPHPLECNTLETPIDKNLVQINVSNEELEKRIRNFIERKRDQVNLSNIQDFIPVKSENEKEDTDTCARVRTLFVKRSDSKGHLKIRKVHNEWGPQTVRQEPAKIKKDGDLPPSISERVCAIETYLNTGPVAKDIYKRLKDMEDKINHLQSVSPEYSMFWKNKRETEIKQEPKVEHTYTAEDIAKKIEMLERQSGVEYSD
ncbi:molybdopterin synthase catalytic subunit isoform X1 [Danaus plexippus]|uniref:Molybdopterin synthase catalytic subunit n=1 Tax=Danaus plexippus plexippus TaxID=278856 RepID=A0A212EUY9_DANPL|nr:molybdopterin synthase catalytic subunit isoform X1 [Danaus plexippus]XP_032521686.1 molybdopterin synthase catalytic subunit isoform X1 [Danaus plexippus]XP_061384342.1 molybdopterin synthase catalytic subunit isoform X1 [Danaus plexippus]XP_061384343.1 molybdopterin synthase catalytic subunit isoform X1 [Danaus plexippus]OWR45318.1 molybdopterin synthase catalytic subunit like protein [Danaus plexippus plexippus]